MTATFSLKNINSLLKGFIEITDGRCVYIAENGDTLFKLRMDLQLSREVLEAENEGKVNFNHLVRGVRINLPGIPHLLSQEHLDSHITYGADEGDSLWKIATSHKLSQRWVRRCNPTVDFDYLMAQQLLCLGPRPVNIQDDVPTIAMEQ
ncbi:unnamed protein product [Caenorhabditis auriculariae]|uniref:LysM domain-containing protein n=1 Tax=Caenorhabditis auriculariae TaxID=2777116 RepID=A0A8S1HE96_9PELO|nr:unnamed protein product [Caenorhabditis auriculariae]